MNESEILFILTEGEMRVNDKPSSTISDRKKSASDDQQSSLIPSEYC